MARNHSHCQPPSRLLRILQGKVLWRVRAADIEGRKAWLWDFKPFGVQGLKLCQCTASCAAWLGVSGTPVFRKLPKPWKVFYFDTPPFSSLSFCLTALRTHGSLAHGPSSGLPDYEAYSNKGRLKGTITYRNDQMISLWPTDGRCTDIIDIIGYSCTLQEEARWGRKEAQCPCTVEDFHVTSASQPRTLPPGPQAQKECWVDTSWTTRIHDRREGQSLSAALRPQ